MALPFWSSSMYFSSYNRVSIFVAGVSELSSKLTLAVLETLVEAAIFAIWGRVGYNCGGLLCLWSGSTDRKKSCCCEKEKRESVGRGCGI